MSGAMDPFVIVLNKLTRGFDYTAQFFDRPEIILVLTMVALMTSLCLLRLRR